MERPQNIPFDFVLDELESMNPVVGRMFGSFSIYIDDKIIFILRERDSSPEDNGMWIATTAEHHETLQKDLPSMRSIALFGPGPTGWQIIPFESDDFDRDVLKACALVRRRDPRIGKIPARKRKSTVLTKKKVAKKKSAKKAVKGILKNKVTKR